jgi:hypothetical protein
MPTPSQIKSLSIKRCQESVIGPCAEGSAGCCGIVSCAICVKAIDIYGEVISGSLALYTDDGYFTSVNGHTFSGVWTAAYDVCLFTVTIDAGSAAEQTFTYSCYDSPCRAVSGVATVPEGTIEWSVSAPIPLARRTVDGCLHEFCEECGCATEKICVKITGDECNAAQVFPFSGELNDCGEAITVEYDFSLSCGDESFDGTISLRKATYTDDCELVFAITGEDDTVMASGCTIAGDVSVTRYGSGSYTISVSEAPCDACVSEVNSLCCPDPIPTTLYLSGGLIPNGGTVALTCVNCSPETASNYVERTYAGSFITDWLTNHELGSGGGIVTVFTGRLLVEAEYSCGSGFRLSLAAEVYETTDPVVLPVGQPQISDSAVVHESCDPIFNAYTGIHQLHVEIGGGDPINYTSPQDYYVTE